MPQVDVEVAVAAETPVPLTPAGFISSAREFAAGALDAHVAGNFRRVALDAGTTLEHLAKACLASRSPALLTELRNESNFKSLLSLLGIAGGAAPTLRTVSLRDALTRVRTFVTSTAAVADLQMLIDMRDGTVHAARNQGVEERLVVAFVQQSEALLKDLDIDRDNFWGRQLAVVDALLAEASDKIAHHVAVKLAAARGRLEVRSVEEHPELLKLARVVQVRQSFDEHTNPEVCPVCDSFGIESGISDQTYDSETNTEWEVFTAETFACSVCGLKLDSPTELSAAGIEPVTEGEITDTPPGDWDEY